MEFEIGLPELLLAAVTAIATVLTSVGIQSKWSSKTKHLVAFGVSFVLAIAYLFLQGKLTDLSDIPGTILSVYGLQQLIYKLFQEQFKKIEAATSVQPGEKVIVEEGEKNVVEETGNEDVAQVDVIADGDKPADPEHPARADRVLG